MAGQSEGQKGGQRNVIVLLLIIIALLVVVVGVVVVMMLGKSKNTEVVEEEKRDVVINEDNAEDFAEELLTPTEENKVQAGTYDVVMNSTWNFEDGESVSSNAYVENAAENTNDVYFDVTITDTGETIYESPVIPIGSHLDEIKLDKDLDAGTYNCDLTYHLIDEEQNTLSTLTMALVIVIEN